MKNININDHIYQMSFHTSSFRFLFLYKHKQISTQSIEEKKTTMSTGLSCLLIVLLLNGIIVRGSQIQFPVQACATGVATGNYWSCAAQLGHSIYRLHSWGDDTSIQICGIPCRGNLKGRISKWKWIWDGRFRCDSIAPGIVGEDSKKSRNGAIEWAIQDFIRKAIQSGRFKPEQFQC